MNETKTKLESMDIAADNLAKLKDLFPAVFTETLNEQYVAL